MARPGLILAILASGLLLPWGRSARPAEPPPESGATYRGPAAFQDPEDPLYAVRWTLGARQPRWLSLDLPPRLALSRRYHYDPERRLVFFTYRAGQEDILPPLAVTPEEFPAVAFGQGLRRSWISGTDEAVAEAKARGAADEGLLDFTLPGSIGFAEKLFGEGAPNLRVRGSESITISGSSSWVVGQVTGEQGGGSLFPKLDMRQRLNVNLDGTIGSKLSVSMAQNSDALTPLENSVRIRYRGEEDEILRTVELGNTNLSLPSTQFVSYSTRQEGLFGVKTEAQVGPLEMTAIASREQGEAGRISLDGGADIKRVRVPDWDYVEAKYFYLVDPLGAVPPPPPESIVEVLVYLDNAYSTDNVELGARPARVWIDPAARTPTAPATGAFHLLREEEHYQYYSDRLYGFPFIALTNALSPDQTLAVAYRYLSGPDTLRVGTIPAAETDSLDLKMLRPSREEWKLDDLLQSEWAPVRHLEAKNIYYLQVRNIEPGTLSLDVVQDVAGEGGNNPITLLSQEQQASHSLIQVLGLDQKNNATSQRVPDGKIDSEYIDYENGLIFLPDLRPFDPSLIDIEGNTWREKSWPRGSASTERADTLGYTKDPGSGQAVRSRADIYDRETVPEIYDLEYNYLRSRFSDYHVYSIQGEVKAAVSNVIELGFGGILEGSETVRLNGQELRRDEDYSIDYGSGQLTLRNPDATRPGADLTVTFSQDALFARGSQSLLGASIATRRDPNAALSLSTTWLHQSRSNPDQRPRLRNEPSKTTVGDFGGRLHLSPWALTDLVDALPLVRANQPSRLELNGGVGMSFPNPNTKGEVFIDDMEGTEKSVPTGMNRVNWNYSSTPASGVDYSVGPTPIIPTYYDRGQLLWFSPNTVTLGDITPREDSELQENDPVSALEIVYVPSDSANALQAWGGLVTPLGNVDVSTYQFIEVWVNDFIPYELAAQRRGEVLVDVGSVSEDADWDPWTPPARPNGRLDYEDLNESGGRPEIDEDFGLDGTPSGQEPAGNPGRVSFAYKDAAADSAGDDYNTDIDEDAPEVTLTQKIQKYRGINGTEGNQRLNSEDMDGQFDLDDTNDYAEYRIDLAAPATIDNRRDYPSSGQEPRSGWRMYRIPLSAPHHTQGSVNLSQTRHLRMWFRGVAPGDTLNLQFAGVEIVGNIWELADTTGYIPGERVNVSIVNNKENADYIEPFEVRRVDNVKEREQSISIDFENLEPGSEGSIYKRLQDTYDYTLYQSLSYYVNPRFQAIPGDTVEFFVRIGSDAATDTVSYYEIATDLTEMDSRRRSDGWINLGFDVQQLTSLKLQDPVPTTYQDIGNGLRVKVVGSPSLSRIRRLSAGIRNHSSPPRPLVEGSIWFNELRMGDVRRDVGYATRGSANLVLSDLATVQASVDFQNPDFLRIGDSRGTGLENLRYDFRGQIGLHKFMEPARIVAPLSARVSRSVQTPKFVPNNDVLYEGPRSGAAITRTLDRGVDLSLSRDTRGLGSPLLRYSLDAIRLSGGYTENFRNDVTRADTTKRSFGSASYNLSLGQIRPVRPLGLMNIWLWPRTVGVGLQAGRSATRVWTPVVGQDTLNIGSQVLTTNTETHLGNLSLGTTFQPISGLSYNYDSQRDLIDGHYTTDVVRRDREPLEVLGVDLGRQVQQNHALAFNYTPPLLGRTLSPRFSWTGNSTQNLSPSLTLEDYENAVFTMSNSNNSSLSLSFPLGRMVDSVVGTRQRGGAAPPAGRPPRKRGAGADTTAADKPPEEPALRKFFNDVVRLKDVQATGTLGNRSSYNQIYGSPTWLYRLGWTRDIGVDENVFKEPRASYNQAIGRNTSLRGTTSLTVFKQVGVDLTYQKRVDRTETNNLTGRVTDDVTWPEVRFDWGDLQKRIPLLGRIFKDFKVVSTSYSRNTRRSGTLENPREETQITTTWRPLMNLQGTLPGDWKGTLNVNLSSTESRSDRLGGVGTSSSRSNNSYTLTLNKKFIGISGNANRDVDLKIDGSYSSNRTENRSNTSSRVQTQRRDNIRINTSAGLHLTRALTGTFGLELGQDREPRTNWTRRSIRVYFNTGFNF